MRLKLLATTAAIALVTPAFTGFDDLGDGEARLEYANIVPYVPFSLGAWRARVGGLEEAVRGFVTGEQRHTEAAHPQQATLFGQDDATLSPLARYTPPEGWPRANAPRPADPAKLLGPDYENFFPALAAFRAGDFASGEEASAALQTNLADTAARWVGLKLHWREAGFKRITAFIETHPDWPAVDWLRRRAEDALVAEHQPDRVVKAWFAETKPQTASGKYALARALARDGDFELSLIHI